MLEVPIAEDDLMIADMAEEFLVGCGYEVRGIARTVDEAVALGLRQRPDLLVIDVRLADGRAGRHAPLPGGLDQIRPIRSRITTMSRTRPMPPLGT